MKLLHCLLLGLVALIWGGNFSVVKYGLQDVPPLALSAMRFLLAGLACLVLPMPAIGKRRLLAIGLTLGALMSAFQFAGMHLGIGAALTSVLLQSQVVFTIVLALLFARERLKANNVGVLLLGILGITCFLLSHSRDLPLQGMLMILMASFWWAVGNLLIKNAPKTDPISIMAWMSLIPVLPLALLSLLLEGQAQDLLQAVFSAKGLAASAYLGLGVMIFGYGVWGKMLQQYPMTIVAPFSLLTPVFGIMFGILLFNETLNLLQIIGIALLVLAVALNIVGSNASSHSQRYGYRGRSG